MFNKIKRYFCVDPSDRVNINDIFKPIYYILTLLGLFPYSIRYNEPKNCFIVIKGSIYVRLIWATAYIVIIYIIILESFQTLFAINGEDSHRDVVISKSNYLIGLLALLVYSTVVYTCVFLNRHRFVHILNTIAEAWAETGEENRSEIVKHLRFHSYGLAIGSIVFVFIVNIGLLSVNFSSSWKAIRLAVTFQVFRLIQFTSFAFHFTLVMIVLSLLSDINMQMEKFTKRKISYTNVRYSKVEPRRADVSLMRLELAYMRAFEIKSDICRAFDAPLLVSTIQIFHGILFCIYMTYHGIVGQSLIYTPYYCAILLMLHTIKIFFLAFAGYKLKNEALKIGQTLHRIPTELLDTDMFTKIQHCSTLMKYHGFELSVYGFFSLDMTLIYSMVASITMYLLVLIQLEK